MKYFIFIFLITLVLFSKAQVHRSTHVIEFDVAPVDITDTLYPDTSFKEAIEFKLGGEIQGYSHSNHAERMIPVDNHGFLTAVHLSYAKHYPLVISPDMIWLLICQGLAQHISANPEEFRNQIVSHSGKAKIEIVRLDFKRGDEKNPWHEVFAEFSDSLSNKIDGELYSAFVHEFSTTGVDEKAAFEIALMEAVEPFFSFDLNIACGIPKIYLEGETKDWQWIQENVQVLRKYKLDAWADALEPVLDQFVLASKGDIDKVFWQSFYFWKNMCGVRINGWVCSFFPYDPYGNYREKWLQKSPGERTLAPMGLPSGISVVPFTLIDYTERIKMEFLSGFLGIEQDTVTMALRPVIGYAVWEPPPLNLAASQEEFDSRGMAHVRFNGPPLNTMLDDIWIIDEGHIIGMDFLLELSHQSSSYYEEFLSDKVIIYPDLNIIPGGEFQDNIDSLRNIILSQITTDSLPQYFEVPLFVTKMGFVSIGSLPEELSDYDTERIHKLSEVLSDVAPATINGVPIPSIYYIEIGKRKDEKQKPKESEEGKKKLQENLKNN
ncbi:MAG: DUF4419 domain-containing protein [Bacteroidales bacterium]|nr:DUF4419 domain-containing protein [Bacteroidales bacterium]